MTKGRDFMNHPDHVFRNAAFRIAYRLAMTDPEAARRLVQSFEAHELADTPSLEVAIGLLREGLDL